MQRMVVFAGMFLVLPSVIYADSFRLKSEKTGRMYGPFEYRNGARVMLGKSAFTVVKSEDKAATAPTQKVLDSKSEAEQAAVKAAEASLELIDGDKYTESWAESASVFKKAVKEKQWVMSLQAARKPLGTMISRKVIGKKYVTELPGVPAGEYVVIQFKTSFENKKNAIETFTPMLDEDGKWRMSGYFIK